MEHYTSSLDGSLWWENSWLRYGICTSSFGVGLSFGFLGGFTFTIQFLFWIVVIGKRSNDFWVTKRYSDE